MTFQVQDITTVSKETDDSHLARTVITDKHVCLTATFVLFKNHRKFPLFSLLAFALSHMLYLNLTHTLVY